MTSSGPRRILTFHTRQGRMTDAIRRDLDVLGRRHALPAGPLDPVLVFGRRAPIVFEVGSGHGEAAAGFARTHPDHDLLAVDVHRTGMRQLLRTIDAEALTNVRVFLGDAVGVLDHRIGTNELARVHLFFPDPWPKRAQHKRRFVRPDLLDLVADRLEPGGVFCTATDDPGYAEQIATVIEAHPAYEIVSTERPSWRPVTTYEAKAIDAGRSVREFTAVVGAQPSR